MTGSTSSPDAQGAADVFEAERRRLTDLAYRMLGVHADADDVVQEAWIRFAGTNVPIVNPAAWLTTVVTRLAIDELRSARRRRSTYVGPWLAEPVFDLVSAPPSGPAGREADPADRHVLIESVTLGFMAVLERLSPLERAVFILHDVFELPMSEVAEVIERSDVATRQLASRARTHLAAEHRRFDPAPMAAAALAEQLIAAAASGDIDSLRSHLARDVVAVADGGAQRRAARAPILGAERVARYFVNLASRLDPATEIHVVRANGQVALYLTVAGEYTLSRQGVLLEYPPRRVRP